jgi:hypothetical protein
MPHLDTLDLQQPAKRKGDQAVPPLKKQREFELQVKTGVTCCS